MEKLAAVFSILALLLLSGCASTLPKPQCDALLDDCTQKKAEAESALEQMSSKANSYKTQLDICYAAKEASDRVISSQTEKMNAMQASLAILESARAKTDLIAKYRLAKEYFDDAYGPGKTPTVPKVKRLDELVTSIGDPQLKGILLDFSRCTVYNECENARSRFYAVINSSINSLTYQVAEIVASKK